MSHFDKVIEPLLLAEGGAKEDDQEPGGISIFGVSLVTYREFKGDAAISKEQMKAELTSPDQAKPIYRWLFWDQFDGDSIASEMVAHVYMDQAANRGVEGFRNLLRTCLTWPGRYGIYFPEEVGFPEMNATVNTMPEKAFIRRLIADAQHSYAEIADRKFKDGKQTWEQSRETARIWRVRTHNLLKLLV